ncbi:(2Fe-2S)-binding protein [Hornefia butyriciproducens]|uniref:(2Fe-2S)-binding protein n=1 Tax=Hornefia butyriciproducens TaxID=2652293 RepID=UPI002A91AF41|nr:(2Fe-2S)-binding protein [Hornefia butyriciproducens]MDY5422834.1 (2Fe-2S)-binding protein [Hornefia butyriciproducens]
MDKKSREYEVCLCHHVTRGEVEDFIREHQITDLKTLCESMDVGNKCGGCREDLDMILSDCAADA